jgi:uncharacterized protein (TIGR02246 family)
MPLATLSILAAVLTTNPQTKPMIIIPPIAGKAISKAAEAGVVKTIETLERSWNTHDMDLYAKLLTDDCQWVNVVGMHWNGKQSVVKAHVAFHKTMFKDVDYATESACMRELAPKVVVAVLTVRMEAYTTPDGQKVPEGQTRLTITLREIKGTWLIAQAQNTPIDKLANQFDPGRG